MFFNSDGAENAYEDLIFIQRPACGLRAIISLHSTERGPAFGGIRRRRYLDEAEALADVLALSSAMTRKCALAGLPAGGAKTVILDRPGLDLPAAYRALGDVVEQLNGRYICGPDIGTGEDALGWLRERTQYVNAAENDASTSTAAGVLAGLRGVLDVLDLPIASPTYLIQGLGGVGAKLAEALIDAGAAVKGCDPNPDARARAEALGVQLIPVREAFTTPCDVLMPCAVGGVIDGAVARSLSCRAICGAANNPLSSPFIVDALTARGILYAPDVIVNAGAVIEGVLAHLHQTTPRANIRDEIQASIASIEGRCRQALRAKMG